MIEAGKDFPMDEAKDQSTLKKLPFRKNILLVISLGYAAVLIVFGVLSCIDPENAFSAIEGPLMALIGGSLAVAKDLVDTPGKEE